MTVVISEKRNEQGMVFFAYVITIIAGEREE